MSVFISGHCQSYKNVIDTLLQAYYHTMVGRGLVRFCMVHHHVHPVIFVVSIKCLRLKKACVTIQYCFTELLLSLSCKSLLNHGYCGDKHFVVT